ncbi:MAG TPA: hypothetical protein VFJ82_05675 [Longimicrobium sp.]|nr:hypothetical protein [Longimicrobium sp.]
MDFKTATDRVAGCITHAEIAEACGVSLQSIRQARMDPSSPSYRSPPAGWEEVLAQLVMRRAGELEEFAKTLTTSQ